jgi:hypothetical protein
MKTAEFIPNMKYLSYHILPNEFGDTNISTNCENINDAKKIIESTSVNQSLIMFDKTQKYGYKRIN